MEDFKKLYAKLQNGSDIRGIALEGVEGESVNLTQTAITDIAEALAEYLRRKTGRPCSDLTIGVGHDSRLSAETMKNWVFAGLARRGCKVYDCGLTSTPSMFMSTILDGFQYDGSVMITASHLPFNRNGLKFFTADGGFEGSEIKEVLAIAAEIAEKRAAEGAKESEAGAAAAADGIAGTGAAAEKADLVTAYTAYLRSCICRETGTSEADKPLAGLHIVIDASNGVGGFFKNVLEPLGADTTGSICMNPDGTFPVHIPNPEDKTAIDTIKNAVLEAKGDLGVIFDTDGDRAAVIFSDGEEVNRNSIIALMAAILAEKYPHTTVVTDSVTSDHLTDFLENKLQMKHHRFKRGYKNVINEAIRLNNEGEETHLAIETSGHGALKENYFLDDGAYMSVKIISYMAVCRKNGKKIEETIADLAKPAESKEYRYKIHVEDFRAYGEQLLKDFEAFAESREDFTIVKPSYEGIRISFNDAEVKGWLLLRMSLHDPVLPLNIETEEEGGCEIILNRIADFMNRYDKISR